MIIISRIMSLTTVACGMLMVGASFLTWVIISDPGYVTPGAMSYGGPGASPDVSGFQTGTGAGVAIIGAGIVALGSWSLLRPAKCRSAMAAALACSVFVAFVGVLNWPIPEKYAGFASASPGPGLPFVLAGSAVACGASLTGLLVKVGSTSP
jgi:hypothetical protein